MTRIGLVVVLLLSVACAITQRVEPVSTVIGSEVCIVEKPDVREGFLAEYKTVLQERGYVARMLPANSPIDACPVTSTYVARWSWDVALYMAYAEIRVFQAGKLVGEAIYDSREASASFGKFIDAESKIRELVMELFPARR